jgi:gentisate 1,2-dioxygenase
MEMAKKAGFIDADWNYTIIVPYLERFEALVREDEREARAMTAENTSVYDRYSPEDTIADAIRARGQA